MPRNIPRPLCTQEFMADQERRDRLLEEVPKDTLIRLLRSLSIEYPEFAVRIEAAALASDPSALEAYLLQRIESLPRPDDWYTDDEGEAYTSLWLDPIIGAVREDLLPADPAASTRVLCRILTLDEEILQRVDSSYACVGIRVDWITEILILAASQAPEETLAALHDIQRPDSPLLYRRDALRTVAAAIEAS